MKILFLGDSLIGFFDWQAHFTEHEVVNLGRAGETVEGLLSRIPAIMGKYPPPDLIFIMTGINNVAMEDFGFLGSYGKIIEKLTAAYPRSRIFIHSLLPTTLEWITNESIKEMDLLIRKIAEEKGVNFVDLYPEFIDKQGIPVKAYLLPDGVHLSDEGYAKWAGTLEGIIRC